MDLGPDNFVRDFLDIEVQRVVLESMGGGIVYLRSLSYADTERFRRIVTEKDVSDNPFMSAFSDTKKRESSIYDQAEDYLVQNYLCHKNGDLFFSDYEDYRKWKQKIKPEPIFEIITNIHKNNKLYRDIKTKEDVDNLNKEEAEDLKKKSE